MYDKINGSEMYSGKDSSGSMTYTIDDVTYHEHELNGFAEFFHGFDPVCGMPGDDCYKDSLEQCVKEAIGISDVEARSWGDQKRLETLERQPVKYPFVRYDAYNDRLAIDMDMIAKFREAWEDKERRAEGEALGATRDRGAGTSGGGDGHNEPKDAANESKPEEGIARRRSR